MSAKQKIVDLFPYKIKNVQKFYNRDHPKNVHPNNPGFEDYWMDQLRNYVEGRWIDDEGTWVYMMPKLDFFINYVEILDKKRRLILPRLSDIEWIMYTYFMCCEGFSGFELDHEYTCHDFVRRLQSGKKEDKLSRVEEKKLPESVYKLNGTLKTYVNPWKYLTRHYLIDNPAKEPLGQPLYQNSMQNGMILTARGCHKSTNVFLGDFLHEFLTGGIKSISDVGHLNDRLLFGMGCADSRQLQRSINNIRGFYSKMPGKYKFRSDDLPDYMGPLYKRIQGSWEVGKEINHIVKDKQNRDDILGSNVQMLVLTKDRSTVGAGDRFRRIYFEEVGFLENAKEVHANNKDSLELEGDKVGSAYYLGTGGDMTKIKDAKAMFERPAGYKIFGIPNYWKNKKKKIGLFIPVTYASSDYKDKNGNTDLELAWEDISLKRKKFEETTDSISYDKHVMFNPVEPDEMLRPSSSGVLPSLEAAMQLSDIETWDLFQKRAMVGKLKYDPGQPGGVKFNLDTAGKLRPILRYNDAIEEISKEGAFIMYEQPPSIIPDNLYWVLYDPAKQSGDGSSYHSVIVYKGFYFGDGGAWYDTIVAEWIGRKERLNDNYEEVIKIAKFFNARIFPEINVAGFVEWCRRPENDYSLLLEGDAYQLELEISPNHKRSWYKSRNSNDPKEKELGIA